MYELNEIFVWGFAHMIAVQALTIYFSNNIKVEYPKLKFILMGLSIPGLMMLITLFDSKLGIINIYMVLFLVIFVLSTTMGIMRGISKLLNSPPDDEDFNYIKSMLTFWMFIFITIIGYYLIYKILPEYGIQAASKPGEHLTI